MSLDGFDVWRVVLVEGVRSEMFLTPVTIAISASSLTPSDQAERLYKPAERTQFLQISCRAYSAGWMSVNSLNDLSGAYLNGAWRDSLNSACHKPDV